MSSLRRLRSSAPAAPLDDDDLLSEIVLRLPPQPSSLPRASFVCKRWRHIISNPAFLRRFRNHHRRNAPLLGCFVRDLGRPHFYPTLEAPDRLHPERFCLQLDDAHSDSYRLLGCRHGLLLIFTARQILVWDPITGDQHHLDVPPAFDINGSTLSNGAVLRAAGDVHFQVVLAATDNHNKQARAFAWVYSSETCVWSNLISILLPTKVSVSRDQLRMTLPTMLHPEYASVLVGNSFYWLLIGNSVGILEFDMDTQSLAVIQLPVDILAMSNYCHHIMQADGGGLGMFSLSAFSAQLWKRETDSDGVASWVMGKTIELDSLLSLSPRVISSPIMLGFAEGKNVVFLWTVLGIFMVQLDSLQFKNLFKSNIVAHWYPFEGVYTETSIGGGHDGAELLQNT